MSNMHITQIDITIVITCTPDFRYLKQITVRDIQTNQVWHVVCDDWLTARDGRRGVFRVLAVETCRGSRSYHFGLRSVQYLREEHDWLSVWVPLPHSLFTRVQRVSCVMSFMMFAMLVDIMLYGQPPADVEHSFGGMILLNRRQLAVSLQCLLISLPCSIIIITVFTNAKPRETHTDDEETSDFKFRVVSKKTYIIRAKYI